MTTATFTTGQKFQHYNGYVWTIKHITGKTISLESQEGEQTIKGSMTVRDLTAIIKAGYYKPIN